jgi:hypothetical protein
VKITSVRTAVIDGEPLFRGVDSMVDPETGQSCVMLRTADGALACAPRTLAVFLDERCSRPVAFVSKNRCDTSALPRRARLSASDACGRSVVTEIFAVGAEATVAPGTTLYRKDSDSACRATSVADTSQLFEAHPISLDVIPHYTAVVAR